MVAQVKACADLGTTALTGKWLAMFRYIHGFASFEETEAAFAAHPEWRNA